MDVMEDYGALIRAQYPTNCVAHLAESLFRHALERIRDIRASEKVFYCQALEIYATSIDYDPKAEISIAFFIKMPFAAKILNEM